ncbi:hypothetical protein Tco_1569504 [Tanacetum coccineum]
MTTLAEFMIIASADNLPPMWEIPFVEEDGTTRIKRYEELLVAEKLQADCDLKAINVVLQAKPMIEFPKMDSGLVVPVFNQGDDPISCLNKAMAFLTAVASSRFSSTNNQLRTSSNPRNQATIQDGRVTVQQVQWMQGQSYAGNSYKGNATSSGGIMQEGRQGWLNVIIIKVKVTWLDPGIPDGQAAQKTILNIASFWTEDLDAYDSNSDDVSNAKAVMMATLSNYSSGVISKAAVQDTNLYAQQDSMILSVIEQMLEQMINHVNNWEKANQEKNNESLTAELQRYKERVKTFEQRLNIELSTREKTNNSQMDDMIKEKLALKQQIDLLKQNLSLLKSKYIKSNMEKESLCIIYGCKN